MPQINTPNPTNFSDAVPSFGSAAITITPSDVGDDLYAKAVTVYVGVAGNVTIRPEAQPSTTVTFQNVPAGSLVPCRALGVMATGTTATGLVGLY